MQNVQLDQNRIVIRERDYLEILDLAVRVIRVYAWPLTVAFACGVVPAMCLNYWLLADYADYDFDRLGFPLRYLLLMLPLVMWEMPLATAPMTLFLGRALFTDRPPPREIVRGLARSLPQMLWYQVIVRALLIPLVFTWFFLFAAWPYLSEVILLERNPMWAGRSGQMTTGRRRQALHGGYIAELFGRWLGSMAVGLLLFCSFWASIWLVGNLLLNKQIWEPAAYTFSFPLALWLVVGYFTVVRFLSYLDLRIRREGWEVELMMRAERARLKRRLT